MKSARFLNHPIHPWLVHLPIGLWTASFLFDLIQILAQRDPRLSAASYYCLAVGIAGALLAAPFGLVDWLSLPAKTRARRVGLAHLAANVLAIALFAASLMYRRLPDGSGPLPELSLPGFFVGVIGMGALALAGFLGGVLVYELGVGVNRRPPVEPDQQAPEQEKRAA